MKPSTEFLDLLDLSFLSTEEEAKILKVLQRDEELRKNDTGRVRRLKANTPNPQQLRVMTGEWFEDLKAKRYGQPCDITAVVKSSMRKKRTPAPKINPFMGYTASEGRGDSNQLSTSRRLPDFAEETYRGFTDEDFSLNEEPSSEIGEQKSPGNQHEGGKQWGGKSSNPFLNTQSPPSATSAPGNHSPEASGVPRAENRSFAFMPFKSNATSQEAVKPAESSRRVSLPPALRKGASVEDSWVKISVEPNTVTGSDLKEDESLPGTGRGENEGSEAYTSCSSSDSEESQSVPLTPSEPVLLHFNQNVSDDINISHQSVRPVPRRRTFQERSGDSDTAKRPVVPETTSSVSSSSTSTTEQTETIRYEVTSSRSQSPAVISCSGSVSAELHEKSVFEMTAPEIITLKKQPRMDFSYAGSGDPENIQVLSSGRDVDRLEEEARPSREVLKASVDTFGQVGFESTEPTNETGGESRALGNKDQAVEPALLYKVPPVERRDPPVDLSESVQYAGHEQPDYKLVGFGKSPEMEYKIPKPSTHSFLASHAEDETVSSDLSGSQLEDWQSAKQTENNCVREKRFEVSTGEDELGINQRPTKIKLPAVQTEVPQSREQMQLDESLHKIRPGEKHSSALTASGPATGEMAVANMPTNDGLYAQMKLSSESDRPGVTEEEEERSALFVMKPRRTFAALPLQPSDDHMTRGSDVLTLSEKVMVGEIRDPPETRHYNQEDAQPVSLESQEANQDVVAEDTSSAGPGSDEETQSSDAYHDLRGAVQLSGGESTETENFSPTRSGAGRQGMRKRDAADPNKTVESARVRFKPHQGNPFASDSTAVGGVLVSGEESLSPEHVSSSVDVRPPRPEEDQSVPNVQLGNGNHKIPAIVVMPSHSQQSGGTKGGQKSEAVKGIIASSAELEDEGLDSGDDQSSVSSYGSELSARKSHLSHALSAGHTGSLLSIYSDAGDYGNVVVQGAVEFAMMYSPAEELIIMVEQCQDLAYGNARKQRTDPYVKTYLLPDKFRRTKRKTSIKKQTINPVYVESLRYKIKKKDLQDKTLHLSIWHNDSRGRNVFLGQVELNLKTWDWGHEALTWYNLQPKGGEGQESQDYRGMLLLALKYVPQVSTGDSKQAMGEVHVWLKEAKDLVQLKSHNMESFVKCYMLPDTSKKSRQKTRVVKKSQNPVYNHAMVFDGFREGEVKEACCELTVWDHHKLSNQFLGGLRLGVGTGESYGKKVEWMDSVNQEVEVWERMLSEPNTWVEGMLPLRSSMTPKK